MSSEDDQAPAYDQATELDEHGRVLMSCELRGGVPHGLLQRFDPEAGLCLLKAQFVDGQLHGLMQTWDESGQPAQEIEYAAGRQHGALKVYAAGVCVAEQMWVHGQLCGMTISRDTTGDISARIPYEDGAINGVAEFFLEGRLVRSVSYRKGTLHGPSLDYDAAGTVVQSAIYEDNRLQGLLQRFWPSGELMEETRYEAGKPVAGPRRFDEEGHELSDAKQGEGSVSARLQQLMRGR